MVNVTGTAGGAVALRRTLLWISGLSFVVAIVVAVTGGFAVQLAGLRLTSHNPVNPFAIGVAAALAARALSTGRAFREDLAALWRHAEVTAPWIAGLAALAALAVGVRWGSFVAGGSDSYGYISQAALWVSGRTEIAQPIATTVPWPLADWTFTPLGYRPGTAPGVIVPMYPPGLPLTMAAFWKVGGPSAVYLVVPVAGALAVWLTFAIGRTLDGPLTGLVSAILTAASPIFLYQVVQPMSDVPVTAWWLLALALIGRGTWGAASAAGVAASLAVLTRPNLAPLAVVLAAAPLFLSRGHASHSDRRGAPVRNMLWFCAGLAPGALALVWINTVMYGSPFSSSYGSLEQFFAWAHIRPNLTRYSRWLLDTHTPFVCLALAAPAVFSFRAAQARSRDRDRSLALPWFYLLVVFTVFASYLVYVPFDAWWYLRFLLPALPLIVVLSTSVALAGIRRLPGDVGAPVLVLSCALLASFYVRTANDRAAFDLQAMERRYADVGAYVATNLPSLAVLVAMQHSGSVHHYSGRLIVRWDWLEPAWLDRALIVLGERGYVPYILLESWEEPLFRTRFSASSAYGALDWPPHAELAGAVRIYNPADRSRLVAGNRARTEQVPKTSIR